MTVSEQILEMYKEGKISEATAFKLAVFKQDLIEKVAGAEQTINWGRGIKKVLPQIATGFLVGGSLMAGQQFANATSSGIQNIKIKRENQGKFEAMLREHPDLMSSDPEAVKSLFKTLVRFAPSFASDPAAAGSYIKRVLKFDPEGGSDYNTIATLVKLEKDHASIIKKKDDNFMADIGSKIVGTTIKGLKEEELAKAFNV